MRKFSSRLWIIPLLVAWGFDFLFWKKQPGISFAIFALLCVLGGLILTLTEGLRPARITYLLVIPWGFFVVMSFVRQEPFTLFVSYVMTSGLMLLMALTLLGGRWIFYGVVDYVAGFFLLAGSAIGRGLGYWLQKPDKQTEASPSPNQRTSLRKIGIPIIRGVLLAIPVIAIFSGLLASADPVFSKYLNNLLAVFKIENLPEYLFRASYILILAYLLVGAYLHAFTRSGEEKLIGQDKPLVPPFLGLTEAAIVLGSVNLLFALFVGIQFRYFFGGSANVTLEGYTYSEYARRGFGELMAVAVFSLLLFLGLSNLSRRQTPLQRKIYSGLGVLLVILVSVILVSAFQRLLLYEEAYGFTRLRTYTHVLMIWIGLLLLTVVALELIGRLRFFALAAMLAIIGFGVSLSLLNVDTSIVRHNVNRALAGEKLDAPYLNTLSDDAVPELFNLYHSASLPAELRDPLGGVLACQAKRIEQESKDLPWQSFNLSRHRAQQWLNVYQSELGAYSLQQDERGGWFVLVQDKKVSCFSMRED